MFAALPNVAGTRDSTAYHAIFINNWYLFCIGYNQIKTICMLNGFCFDVGADGVTNFDRQTRSASRTRRATGFGGGAEGLMRGMSCVCEGGCGPPPVGSSRRCRTAAVGARAAGSVQGRGTCSGGTLWGLAREVRAHGTDVGGGSPERGGQGAWGTREAARVRAVSSQGASSAFPRRKTWAARTSS